ncbi:hypothetical protein AU252_00750 [Pseudarthrobacter sulfonivorans]|uniref:AMP-dependent synthetase n=1 Tax=Pseudarthrobacter sulfonivorans TaxID=121292 RepID=A0A0U3P3G0_9MICC|nr:AMP-binding protein [Pseudarthrobacter sulfonivorans]ALV39872.1 hypothetical protein AU252_00750 [Pseudarthrobacter sulfonivorans]
MFTGNTSVTLYGELARAAADNGDQVFLRDSGTLTFAELRERADSVAGALAARGVGAGDRIAVATTNRREWVELLFASARLGAIMVSLNVRYRDTELTYMLTQSGAKIVVTERSDGDVDFTDLYARVIPLVPSLGHVVYLDTSIRLEEAIVHDASVASIPASNPVDDPASTAVILYTSGTTGSPKGAVLTHRSLLAAAAGEVERIGFSAQDRMLATMPFNHVGGLTCTLLSALLARGQVVLHPAFSPTAVVNALTNDDITIFAGVPMMWKLILATLGEGRTLSGLRVAIVGGSNAEPTMCQEIRRAGPTVRLVNLYGMTEFSGPCLMSELDDDLETISTTLGTALDGVETRVVDFDGGIVDGEGDGELQVRGAAAAAGYWDQAMATADTFRPGGWVATGDIVARTGTGHFRFRGRLKEMFIQGGYNVYPVEVENVLTSHQAVVAAAGIGISDTLKGEIGHYFVTIVDGSAITADTLIEYCAGRLANYKVPVAITIVDKLPTTPGGKIGKADLRKLAAVQSSQLD